MLVSALAAQSLYRDKTPPLATMLVAIAGLRHCFSDEGSHRGQHANLKLRDCIAPLRLSDFGITCEPLTPLRFTEYREPLTTCFSFLLSRTMQKA
jgi:hypothetical protein